MNIDLVALVGGITSLIIGVGTFLKAKADSRKSVAQAVSEEIKAVQDAYSGVVQHQIKMLVEPMQSNMESMQNQINILREQVTRLQRFQGLFEVSIQYIRSLCHWIEASGLGGENKPHLPNELRDYIDSEGNIIWKRQ